MVITQKECKFAGEFKNSPIWKVRAQRLFPDGVPCGKTLSLCHQRNGKMQICVHKNKNKVYFHWLVYMFPVFCHSNILMLHTGSLPATRRELWGERVSNMALPLGKEWNTNETVGFFYPLDASVVIGGCIIHAWHWSAKIVMFFLLTVSPGAQLSHFLVLQHISNITCWWQNLTLANPSNHYHS